MLVSYGDPNCEIYDDTKTIIPIITQIICPFYSNSSHFKIMHAKGSHSDCVFSVAASTLCNRLPADTRNVSSLKLKILSKNIPVQYCFHR